MNCNTDFVNNCQVLSIVAVAVTLLAACASGDAPSQAASTITKSEAYTEHQSSGPPSETQSGTPSHDAQSSESYPQLLLAAKYGIWEAGGPVGAPTCTGSTPDGFPEPPEPNADGLAAWLATDFGSEIGFMYGAWICLIGFDSSTPIDLEIDIGDSHYRTALVPSSEGPPAPPKSAHELLKAGRADDTLFDGRSVLVYSYDEKSLSSWVSPEYSGMYAGSFVEPAGVLKSLDWTFLPPEDVRLEVLDHPDLTLRASQGTNSATFTQPFKLRRPDSPIARTHYVDGKAYVTVAGPPETRVPIGLYEYVSETLADGAIRESAELQRQVGEVTLSASGFAEFAIPPSILSIATQGHYCLETPQESGIVACSPLADLLSHAE